MAKFLYVLLDFLVAKRKPTPGYDDVYSVGTPSGHVGEKYGQTHCKTTFSPRFGVFCCGLFFTLWGW